MARDGFPHPFRQVSFGKANSEESGKIVSSQQRYSTKSSALCLFQQCYDSLSLAVRGFLLTYLSGNLKKLLEVKLRSGESTSS